LKQENDFVRTTLLNWINSLISTYNIDGIRIDTIPEVPKWFWKQFSASAGVYQVGEVFDGRLDYVSDYQNCCLDAVLNYPLFFTFKNVFINGSSFNEMESSLQNINKYFHDPSVLGVFVNNHDNSRFLHNNSSVKKFRNAIAFSLLTSKSI
jgi:alpha-amylase